MKHISVIRKMIISILAVIIILPQAASISAFANDSDTAEKEYVRIKNKWTGQYLYEVDGKVKYGNIDAKDARSHWLIVDYQGHKRIQNRATGHYLAMKNHNSFSDPLDSIAPQELSPKAGWIIENANSSGYITINSVYNEEFYIHVQDQTGYAQCSVIPPGWGSAQWLLEEAPDTYFVPKDDDGVKYIRIKNKWIGMYLYEENGEVKYGNIPISDKRSQWIVKDYNGHKGIQNRATGHYMTIENKKDFVESISVDNDSLGAQWIIEEQSSGYKTIESVLKKGQYIHVEDKLGHAQYGAIPPNWGSPQWKFVEVPEGFSIQGYTRIKNSWTGKYLYEENNKVKYGHPGTEDPRSHWLIENYNGHKRIKNRATGHYMAIENLQDYLDPLESIDINNSWTSAQWTIKKVDQKDAYVIQNVWKSNYIVHVQDQTGYAQASDMNPNWGSAHWLFEKAPPLVPEGYVRIQSNSNGKYLYENQNNVVLYGTPGEKNARSHWIIKDYNGHKRIQNRATDHYLTIDKDKNYVESIEIGNESKGTFWEIETSPSVGNILIRSNYFDKSYLHIGDFSGFPQYGVRSIEMETTQWSLEKAPTDAIFPSPDQHTKPTSTKTIEHTNYVRIFNRLEDSYLYELNGEIKFGHPEAGDQSSQWLIEDFNGYQRIKNRATGHYLTIGDQKRNIELNSLENTYVEAHPLSSQWKIVNDNGFKIIKAASVDKTIYLSHANAQLGTVHKNHQSEQWLFKPVVRTVRYEAEEAFVSGDAAVKSDYKGYKGKGYVKYTRNKSSRVIFAVNSPSKGRYQTVLRYSNDTGKAKHLQVYVNGIQVRKLALPPTKNSPWRSKKLKLQLRQGMNTVTLKNGKKDRGTIKVDYILVNNSINKHYRGATLPYVEYEAEDGKTNGTILGPDRSYRTFASEASGRQAVRLDETGEYVAFTLAKPANAINIRYVIPDSGDGGGITAPISLYVNGKYLRDITLTSKYSWVYGRYPWSNDPSLGKAHHFYNETRLLLKNQIPAGSTIKLKVNKDGTAPYYIIDLVDMEEVGDVFIKPAHFLSITGFGAEANDHEDDTLAMKKAINAAKKQNKGVWIPKGTFNLTNGPIALSDITIHGAGVWYTVVKGAGFIGEGNHIRVFDLTIDGNVTARNDRARESGFDGAFGTGSTIQNVWIKHTKAGIWSTKVEKDSGEDVTTDGLYIFGCRIRDTFADGINFSTGTKNSVVTQTSLRNTGDDALAMWSLEEATKYNTFRFNTVELPWLSNNIAIYGGIGNKVMDNVVYDTVAFGGGIVISTRHNPVPFGGTTVVQRNTLIRTGGREYNWNVNFGGLVVFPESKDMNANIVFRHNNVYDSSYQGISIHGPYHVSNVTFKDIVIDGAGTWGVNITNNASGSSLFDNVIVRNVTIGDLFNGAGSNFSLQTIN